MPKNIGCDLLVNEEVTGEELLVLTNKELLFLVIYKKL